jgi:hypothetical protein
MALENLQTVIRRQNALIQGNNAGRLQLPPTCVYLVARFAMIHRAEQQPYYANTD